MGYNYDFCIAALVVHFIFLCFFLLQKRLSTRQNHAFLWLLFIEALTIITDIAACVMDSRWQDYSAAALYFINILYFMLFIARFMAFYEYCTSISKIPASWPARRKVLLALPFLVSELICLSSFFTGAFFSITPDAGYVKGPLYNLIYWVSIFYVLFSLFTVSFYRRECTAMDRIGIYAFSALLFCGLSLRASFPNVLILDAFVELGITMIYLTMQNPLFFRSSVADLFNTAAFAEIITEMIRRKKSYSVIAFGIDQYDSNRNIYGISQMDKGLNKIGFWIRSAFPEMEPFYIGHGRFVLFSRKNPSAQAVRDVIQDRFAGSWKGKETEIFLNASVSCLKEGQDIQNWETLLNAINASFSSADMMKTGGMTVIDESIIARMDRAHAVQNAIERGIRNDAFEVWFQPIYSTASKKVIAAEALARLNDEILGRISPDEFIILAEQNGMISVLGIQIFEKVCRFMKEHRPEEYGIEFINVNLSPIQCMNENLCSDLRRVAGSHGISLSLVDFEITETAAADTAFMKEQMFQLIQNGASFSLDDYGMGFTNLSRLLELPLRVAKLDKSVVWSYFRNENRIMEDLIRMFKNQNLRIVAEGVETAGMAEGLTDLGCDFLQGFYFSKPLPEQEFIAYLEEHNKKEEIPA